MKSDLKISEAITMWPSRKSKAEPAGEVLLHTFSGMHTQEVNLEAKKNF